MVLCEILLHQQGLTLDSVLSYSYHFTTQETSIFNTTINSLVFTYFKLGALGLWPILFPSWDLASHLYSEGAVPSRSNITCWLWQLSIPALPALLLTPGRASHWAYKYKQIYVCENGL